MFLAIVMFFLGIFGFILIGVATAYALGIIPLLFLFITRGLGFPPGMIVVPVVKGLNNFILLAVPLFILVGRLMNESGLTERVFNLADVMLGHLRGGLGYVNVMASMIFAGMSGAATADAAGLGAIEYKAMSDKGYDPGFSSDITLSSALIGPIIPPSIPVLLYSALSEVTATGLLLAGIIPGIVMALMLMLLVGYFAWRRKYPKGKLGSFGAFLVALKRAFLTLLTPVILVGGIMTGVFTPTESAAVAVLYLLILILFVYRTVSLRKLYSIFAMAAKDTGVVMFLLALASLYGWMLTRLRAPIIIMQGLLNVSTNPYITLTLVIVFLLAMGCFLSASVCIILMTPIVYSVAPAIGFNPVHFGIIVIMAAMIGSATPPVGSSLYALCRVTRLPVETVARGVAPFLVAILAAIGIVILVPPLALFVPELVLSR